MFYYPATLLRGENVLHHMPHYRRFQWYTPQEVERYQLLQLNRLLEFAYQHSEYYRELFDKEKLKPCDIRTRSDIKLIPVLTKGDLLERAKSLESGRPIVSRKTTGGSTGQPVTVLKNPGALARERAATWRGYEWAGVGVGYRQARLWGVPIRQKSRISSYIVDLIANRRRFSAFNLTDEKLEEYCEQLRRFRPAYLYGYVSMIAELAAYVRRRGCIPLPGLRSVITTSEVLTQENRALIEEAFGCRVFNEYGCGEVGSIAHECEHGSMHLMSDNLIVEIDSSREWQDGVGEIIVTDLHNYAMPLIRYKVGDLGTMCAEQCTCGRGLHRIEKVHGRAYDFIIDPQGVRHHPELILYIVEDMKRRGAGIAQFQAVQTDYDQIDMTIVPASSYSRDAESHIAAKVHTNIHPAINVRFLYGSHIDREPSGKLRVVKSLLMQNP